MNLFRRHKDVTANLDISTLDQLSAIVVSDSDGTIFASRVLDSHPNGGWIAEATDLLREYGVRLISAKHCGNLVMVDGFGQVVECTDVTRYTLVLREQD